MFLHLSLILFPGGSALVHAGIHIPPPWADSGQTSRPLGRHPLWADTPSGRCRHGHTLPAQCMLGYTPLPSAFWDTHAPQPPAQSMLGYTWLLLRMVRILLECILVSQGFDTIEIIFRNDGNGYKLIQFKDEETNY